MVLLGGVTGLGAGAAQSLVLTRLRVGAAPAWALANPAGWALGWLISSYVITTNVDERFTNFGAAGAIVFGVFSGFLLARLLRPRH